jgi:hypothetical protein
VAGGWKKPLRTIFWGSFFNLVIDKHQIILGRLNGKSAEMV